MHSQPLTVTSLSHDLFRPARNSAADTHAAIVEFGTAFASDSDLLLFLDHWDSLNPSVEPVQILAIHRPMRTGRTRPSNRDALEYAACILPRGIRFRGVYSKHVEGFGTVAVVLFEQWGLTRQLCRLDVWIERPRNGMPYVYGEW